MEEDRGPQLAAVLGLFLGLSWIFISLRIYVKTQLSKSWGWDDTLLCTALIFFTAFCCSGGVGVHYGTGRHISQIPLEDIPKALHNWWLGEIFYGITTALIRLSIAVFLLRLCEENLHRNIIIATIVLVCLISTAYLFLVIFQCSPTSYFWAQFEGLKGRCMNPNVVPGAGIAHSAVGFITDWTLGLLPIAILWKLRMNQRTKACIAILLSMGVLAGIATIIRIPFIRFLALTDDFLYATTDVAIWSTIEPGLGIMAFSGATFRPLFRRFYNLSTYATPSGPYHSHSDAHSHSQPQPQNPRFFRSISSLGLAEAGKRRSLRRSGYIENSGDRIQMGPREDWDHGRNGSGSGSGNGNGNGRRMGVMLTGLSARYGDEGEYLHRNPHEIQRTNTNREANKPFPSFPTPPLAPMKLHRDLGIQVPRKVVISKGSPRFEIEGDPLDGLCKWGGGKVKAFRVSQAVEITSVDDNVDTGGDEDGYEDEEASGGSRGSGKTSPRQRGARGKGHRRGSSSTSLHRGKSREEISRSDLPLGEKRRRDGDGNGDWV